MYTVTVQSAHSTHSHTAHNQLAAKFLKNKETKRHTAKSDSNIAWYNMRAP